MISSVVFRLYTDYKAGTTSNDVVYDFADGIYNIQYPEFKIMEDYSFFAQSPSVFSFSLQSDVVLDEKFGWNISKQKSWSKYVCLIEDNGSLFFSGILPLSSISYSDNGKMLSFEVYDFMSLLQSNSNLALQFNEEINIVGNTGLKEPFFQERLLNESDIFNFCAINAEAIYFDNFVICEDADGTILDRKFVGNFGENPFTAMISNLESAGYTVQRIAFHLTKPTNGANRENILQIIGYVIGEKNSLFGFSMASTYYEVSDLANYNIIAFPTGYQRYYSFTSTDQLEASDLIASDNNYLCNAGKSESYYWGLGLNSYKEVSGISTGKMFIKMDISGDHIVGFTFTLKMQQFENDPTKRATIFQNVFPNTFNVTFPNRFESQKKLIDWNVGGVIPYRIKGIIGTQLGYYLVNLYNDVTSTVMKSRNGVVINPATGGLRYFFFRSFVNRFYDNSYQEYHYNAVYAYCDLNLFSDANTLTFEEFDYEYTGSPVDFLAQVTPFSTHRPTWYGVLDLSLNTLQGTAEVDVNLPYSDSSGTYTTQVRKNYMTYNRDIIFSTQGYRNIWYLSIVLKTTNAILPWQDLTSNSYLRMLMSFHNITLRFDQTTLSFIFSDRTKYTNSITLSLNDVLNFTQNIVTPEYVNFSEFGDIDILLQNKINLYYNNFFSQINQIVNFDLSTVFNAYSVSVQDVVVLGDVFKTGDPERQQDSFIVVSIKKINDYIVNVTAINNPAKVWTEENGLELTDENSNKLNFKF